MSAPKEVLELTERFERNRDAYRSSAYNEAQVRLELINPLFKALGWDMYNEAGYAEAYKEVIHEDAIKVGGATKAPDYSFRIGGVRKFFVEAKRPSVGVKDDPDAAYQLRRYAWSAKLPLSILTDFEEFAVYDCRVKPAKTDKASAARVLYLTVEEYADQWDEIATIFSQEAVLKGSFDKYAESTKKKRGTAEVDDAFLKEIENWRDLFARNIALRNPKLSTRELNFAVQRTIDRIIFLRICEDRGVEEYGQLMALQSGNRIYPRLCQIFRRADERYNSGLFHFRKEKDRPEPPDDLTLGLEIDDKVLKGIVKDLYYPDSPYEFSVLPADILGHIYEQFLGKVIRLTSGHHAKVEDKPEVKKAGGVYYTPTYIVDYIVKHTVGKLLEGKTPQQVSKLRILDPACGSGSFLLGAYQTLLDWHLEWYSEHDPEKHAKGRSPKIFRGPGGDWRLTTAEKKRILLNNIYGVDIDPQAVEVTKLSLLLKVLEGENEETIGQSLRLFHERALPDLADNIKCGNSLIGPDFYEGKQLSLIDEEERYRINAFDWDAEFPAIMQAGGFDAVIGNPPYVSFGLRAVGKLTKEESQYYRRKFADSAEYKISTYALFMQLGIDLLCEGGHVGMIVPDSFLLGRYFSKLRRHIMQECLIQEIMLIRARVFAIGTVGASVVFTFTKIPSGRRALEHCLRARFCENTTQFSSEDWLEHSYQQSYFSSLSYDRFRLFFRAEDDRLVRKIDNTPSRPLSTFIRLSSGLIGRAGKQTIVSLVSLGEQWQPGLLSGAEVGRYSVSYAGGFILYDITKLKSGFKDAVYNEPKLFCRQTGDRLVWAYDESGHLCLNNLHVGNSVDSQHHLLYVLGIVNSRLINKYYELTTLESGRALAQTDIETLNALPIRTIDFSVSTDKARHDRMIELVDTLLKLHKDLQAAKTDHEKSLIQRQIDATDKQIDQLVYELYGLTDKEIRIVEEATK